MTWTVDAGDVYALSYTLVGKTMTLTFGIQTSSIAGTPDSALQIAIPGGFTAAQTVDSTFNWYEGTAGVGLSRVVSGGSIISLFKNITGPVWAATTNGTYVSGSIVFPIN
jgi:hypothetical protein